MLGFSLKCARNAAFPDFKSKRTRYESVNYGTSSYCYIARLSLNKMSTVIAYSWSRAPDQIQMYPDQDTIAHLLLLARRLRLFVFAVSGKV